MNLKSNFSDIKVVQAVLPLPYQTAADFFANLTRETGCLAGTNCHGLADTFHSCWPIFLLNTLTGAQ